MSKTPKRSLDIKTDEAIKLEQILSPDIARQLYEITEGAKRRENSPSYQVSNISTEDRSLNSLNKGPLDFVVPRIKFKPNNPDIKVESNSNVQDVEDAAILLQETFEHGADGESQDTSYLDRSGAISQEISFQELEFIYNDFDTILSKDLKVLQFGQHITIGSVYKSSILNCVDTNNLTLDGRYHLDTSHFVFKKPTFGKYKFSPRSILKYNDEVHIYHPQSQKFIGIDSNLKLNLANSKYVWILKPDISEFSALQANEYERRCAILESAHPSKSNSLINRRGINLCLRSSSKSLIFCPKVEKFIFVSDVVSLLGNTMLSQESDATLNDRRTWEYTQPYHLPTLSFAQKALDDSLSFLVPDLVDEAFIIKQILFLLIGVEGPLFHLKLIVDKTTALEVKTVVVGDVASKINPAYMAIVKRILPLHQYFTIVESFSNKFCEIGYGKVLNCFSNCLHGFLVDYKRDLNILAEKYFQPDQSLMSLSVELKDNFRLLELLKVIILEVFCKYGTDAIVSVQKLSKKYRYDHFSRSIFHTITQKMHKTYNEFVLNWIFYGKIIDPFGEFFVQINKRIRKRDLIEDFNSAYWSDKYFLKKDMLIPDYLQQYLEIILETGKYINIINDSLAGDQLAIVADFCPLSEGDSETVDIVSRIKQAYEVSSGRLVSIIIHKYQLIDCFDIVQQYLLLFYGDFYTDFLESGRNFLNKLVQETDKDEAKFNLETLYRRCLNNIPDRNWLAIKVDEGSQLPVKIQLEESSLDDHIYLIHTGVIKGTDRQLRLFELVSLSFSIKWPVSLILSKQLLTKYGLLFRLLFVLKYTENILKHRILSIRRHVSSRSESVRIHLMHNFINNLLYYFMFEVIEVRYKDFQKELLKQKEIESIINLSTNYIDSVMRECLLTHEVLLGEIFQVVYSVLRDDKDFDLVLRKFYELLVEEVCQNNYFFLKNLCTRLDFNMFFASDMNRNTGLI